MRRNDNIYTGFDSHFIPLGPSGFQQIHDHVIQLSHGETLRQVAPERLQYHDNLITHKESYRLYKLDETIQLYRDKGKCKDGVLMPPPRPKLFIHLPIGEYCRHEFLELSGHDIEQPARNLRGERG